ncbi:hypothetical protein FEM03_15220 [Phragmitibacter flavus]|uniref:Uncharacterized protein n=1 Tax=Phragmitibacter flavus TaxID=2576071 RepID=A0A5R8KCW1_9BACT|nr:hypothetical protein [Phragmitibacter flavus]TLD70077.1 hypothetical protein FEM03_15220 [Phragmitibacter flavus]
MAATLCGASHPVLGAIVVSESFSGYTPGLVYNQPAQGTNITGTWGGSFNPSVTFVSSSLSFGSMQTSGGALQITATASVSPVSNQAGFNVGPGAGNVTGDLWASFLYRPETTDSDLLMHSSSIGTLQVGPNNTHLSLSAQLGTSSYYDLVPGQTYLILMHYTNVGMANASHGSLMVLTVEQYENWKASGGTESALNARLVSQLDSGIFGRSESDSTGPITFGSGSWASFATDATFFNTSTMTFDEMRFATSLEEAAQVPELFVSSYLILGGLVIFVAKRRRSI